MTPEEALKIADTTASERWTFGESAVHAACVVLADALREAREKLAAAQTAVVEMKLERGKYQKLVKELVACVRDAQEVLVNETILYDEERDCQYVEGASECVELIDALLAKHSIPAQTSCQECKHKNHDGAGCEHYDLPTPESTEDPQCSCNKAPITVRSPLDPPEKIGAEDMVNPRPPKGTILDVRGKPLPPVRCGECSACKTERIGCACDGAYDDGCFLCTPGNHFRPACPEKSDTTTVENS